jgi:hypothetical protein
MGQENYELQQLADEPIIVARLHRGFSVSQELVPLSTRLKTMLDSAPHRINYVADVRGITLSFGELVSAIAMLTRGDLAVLKHPNINKIIGISDSNLVQMAISAIGQQAQYGNIPITLAKSEEDALKLARQ